eukprot:11327486-Heterocapsa_arctica.AAC.1
MVHPRASCCLQGVSCRFSVVKAVREGVSVAAVGSASGGPRSAPPRRPLRALLSAQGRPQKQPVG